MGLDMYLNKKTYVKNWSHMRKDELHKIVIKKGGELHKDIKPKRISEIVEEVGYWRKDWHIHNWFVKNCQNGVDECQEVYVSRDQLKELLNLCNEVIADPDGSLNILPDESMGFDNEEYYLRSLKNTAKMLKAVLKEENGNFYYHSSW